MSTLAERFAELFAERPDIKAIDLARACRVKGPSVAAWLSGKTKQMEAENAIRAAAFFGVHTWWLATGQGPKRIKEGEHDRNAPAIALQSDGWPFTVPLDRYQRLSTTEKRALDRVVSGFIVGCLNSSIT
ncbi:helix-turn-helix domain-containing protein [Castellaniella sp. S9]|uniref:helix-turn-helix domain-containing protein n=1 Tax=Castellaniella sp. S9 TaxID=2993652 RepID=UPI0022B5D640|nr:helix-turn-helix transcriptional regulator [Castellaniella sp. S9]